MSNDLEKAFKTVCRFARSSSNKRKFEECYAIFQDIQTMEGMLGNMRMRYGYDHIRIEWSKNKVVLCDKLESRNFYVSFAEISDLDSLISDLKEKQVQLKLARHET